MYVQFCNEAKSCAYWLVNKTLWYETETIPRHLIFSPRPDRDRDLPTFPRDRDETETFGNYVSHSVSTSSAECNHCSPPSPLQLGLWAAVDNMWHHLAFATRAHVGCCKAHFIWQDAQWPWFV